MTSKPGLAAVALMAVCCGGPVFLWLLASGAALGALGSVWSGAWSPHDQPWAREIEVRDPDGNRLRIDTPRP
jgi:hypothetical protein